MAYLAMDHIVAATFLTDAEIIGSKGPQLRPGLDRTSDQLLSGTFNVLAIMARLNNAAMLLGSYLAHLVPTLSGGSQNQIDEAVEVSRLLGLLQSELVRANGQAVASVVSSRRHLWANQSKKLPSHVKKAFCALPFTPGITFGKGVDDILRQTESLRRDREILDKFTGDTRPRPAPRKAWPQSDRGLSADMRRRLGSASHQPRRPQAQPRAQPQAQPQGRWQGDQGRGRRRYNKGRGGPSAGRGHSSRKDPGPRQST